MRNHRLVCGHKCLAAAQRLTRQGQRRAVRSADKFNHNINIIGHRQRGHVVGPAVPRNINTAILSPVARRDGNNFDCAARAARDDVAVFYYQIDDTDANRPKASERDAERRSHIYWLSLE